jgi:putative membrane protein
VASAPTPTHPSISEPAGSRLDTGTRLAFERTFLAHERTQLAWVRTSLALISFGFAIAKLFQYLHEQRPEKAPPMGSATVGMLMIAIGLVALVIASVQHHHALRALREECPGLPRSLAYVTAVLIAALGIVALGAAILRQ